MNLQKDIKNQGRVGKNTQKMVRQWTERLGSGGGLNVALAIYGPAAIRLLDQIVSADVLPGHFQKKAARIVNTVVALATPRKRKCSRA